MKVWKWAAVLSILLAGCSGEDVSQTGSETTGRPVVFASNYPLQYFAQKISAPLADVRLPVPAGEDPAFWVPTPEDVVALQKADLVILNGASYESWLNNVSLPSSRLVDTSEGFKEQLIAQETTTHSHGPDGEHEHSATAFTTWLDLALAIEQARAIMDAFAARWPEHKGRFEAQFQQLAAELEALDAAISQTAKAAAGVPVLFSHPVYQYFERRYQVNGHSVHWEPDEMPSESMWQELTTLLGSHPAKWMIWEAEPSSEIRAKLAEKDIHSIVFAPCGGAPELGDFASVMKRNLEALKTLQPTVHQLPSLLRSAHPIVPGRPGVSLESSRCSVPDSPSSIGCDAVGPRSYGTPTHIAMAAAMSSSCEPLNVPRHRTNLVSEMDFT